MRTSSVLAGVLFRQSLVKVGLGSKEVALSSSSVFGCVLLHQRLAKVKAPRGAIRKEGESRQVRDAVSPFWDTDNYSLSGRELDH